MAADSHQVPIPLLVTSQVNATRAGAEYASWKAEADALIAASTSARQQTEARLATLTAPEDSSAPAGTPDRRRTFLAAAPAAAKAALDIVSTLGAAAGESVVQLAAALQVDAEIHAKTLTLPALTAHAPIIETLIATTRTGTLQVAHERLLPPSRSAVTDQVVGLTGERVALAAALAAITALSAVVAKEAATAKPTADAVAWAEQGALTSFLGTALSVCTALLAAFDELIARICTVDAAQSSPLQRAFEVQPIMAALESGYLLVLPEAEVSSEQVVLRRRILSPRILVSSYCLETFLLLKSGSVVAAGSASGHAGVTAKLGWFGVRWRAVRKLQTT